MMMKDDIRMMKSQRSDTEKDKLIDESKRIVFKKTKQWKLIELKKL